VGFATSATTYSTAINEINTKTLVLQVHFQLSFELKVTKFRLTVK